MTTPVPSMNAKVDAITDAVEAAIARGNNHPGGVRRFILQGAIRGALRDISDRRIAPRRLYGAGPNAGGRPTTSRPVPRWSRLEFATGVCPRHGPTTFTRRVGAAPSPSLMPFTDPLPSPTPPVLPWNGGGGTMAGRRGVPPFFDNRDGPTAAACPPGFAYDIDVVFPQPLLSPIRTPPRTPSYADVAANRIDGLRRSTNGAGVTSSSVEGEAAGRR